MSLMCRPQQAGVPLWGDSKPNRATSENSHFRGEIVKKLLCCLSAVGIAPVFAAVTTDGVNLINQVTVQDAGGFPYKITQPGSYRLSGNLVVPAAKPVPVGIVISASDVTLDLNGFTLSCSSTCAPENSALGIAISGKNVSISNGTITGFAGTVSGAAIDYGSGTTTASSGRVDRMILSANSIGVQDNTSGAVSVTNSSIINNKDTGVVDTLGPLVVSSSVLAGNPVGINGQGAPSGLILSNLIAGSSAFGLIVYPKGPAYGPNTFQGNGQNADGGVSMGNNVCGSSTC